MYTRAMGALPSSLGLYLGPAHFWSLVFAFHRQRWEPDQATPATYPCPGGDSPGGEDVFHAFSTDDAPHHPSRDEPGFPQSGPKMQGGSLMLMSVLRVVGNHVSGADSLVLTQKYDDWWRSRSG